MPMEIKQIFRSSASITTFHINDLLSGDEGIRTPGLRRAKAALSHLSYIPRSVISVQLSAFSLFAPITDCQSLFTDYWFLRLWA